MLVEITIDDEVEGIRHIFVVETVSLRPGIDGFLDDGTPYVIVEKRMLPLALSANYEEYEE